MVPRSSIGKITTPKNEEEAKDPKGENASQPASAQLAGALYQRLPMGDLLPVALGAVSGCSWRDWRGGIGRPKSQAGTIPSGRTARLEARRWSFRVADCARTESGILEGVFGEWRVVGATARCFKGLCALLD